MGLNHHFGTCVFGAALLYDETTPSFQWLFETFLICMGGKAPVTLMTDQAQAIRTAAKIVLPNTFHGLCTFHIIRNAKTNLGAAANGFFFDELHQMISYVDDEKEFEYCWDKMMEKCFNNRHTSEISWLSTLYSNRRHWCGAWVKSNFTAGKTTTQLSEQFNAFARHYLSPNLPFSTFFARFVVLSLPFSM